MITNERQYRISKARLSRLREAAEDFDIREMSKRTGSEVLAKAELEALRSEEQMLGAQLREYEALKTGTVSSLRAESLGELPGILIGARIAQGLSQQRLADMLALKEQQIQRYESEQYASASLRRLIEVARALSLDISGVAELRRRSLGQRRKEAHDVDWSRFPIQEMYRRHFFTGFSGSLADAMAEKESLAREFVTSVIQQPIAALRRQRVRSGSYMDPYALLAWECRVLALAKSPRPTAKYARGSLDHEWLRKLTHLSKFDDGPVRAKQYLEKAGVSLVIEPNLSHTQLDGAAILYGAMPIIGMTLRYDRLDNFWFVLFHELVHIIKHLRKGRIENIFDNMDDVQAQRDEVERQADEQAGQLLIPPGIWETALARYTRSNDAVTSLAKRLRINPAIIAGRIRNEASNYVILSELIGQNQVRKQFPKVSFG